MDINIQIAKNKQFRAFYIFFILYTMQTGVAMIGTPRVAFEVAGHDAWISIILAYLFVLLVIFIMLFILRQYDNTDIVGIQADLFGGVISKLLGTIYMIYFATHILSILVTYIEIVKIFIFRDIPSITVGLMLVTIIVYSCLGGLRVVIGVVFLFVILSNWVILLLVQPISQMDFYSFLPIMDKGMMEIIQGATSTAYTFMGFEILFFLYPFVSNKKNIRLPTVLGVSYAAFIVLLTTVVSIGFISAEQLGRRVWPVLNLFKLQSSPFIERLDYVVVAEWMMVTTPKAILLMWGITYTAKRLYNISSKLSLYFTSGLLLVFIPFFTEHFEIQKLIDSVRDFGIWIVYVYPLILLPLVVMKNRSRKKKKGAQNHATE